MEMGRKGRGKGKERRGKGKGRRHNGRGGRDGELGWASPSAVPLLLGDRRHWLRLFNTVKSLI